MGAIASHNTAVNKTASWDGPTAITEAKNDEAVLRHMHAWVNEKADPTKKSSYRFAHHDPGTDTPANIQAVNQALVRLSQSDIPDVDKLWVEAHLRGHRIDAGWDAAMSDVEIFDALKRIKKVDDLKVDEVKALETSVKLQEKSNMAEWLESRLHLTLTQIADDMFGSGSLTRNERKVLSGAIGEALDSYHQFLTDNAPQLFTRRPWEDAPEDAGQNVAEAATIKSKARSAAKSLQGLLADKTLPKDLRTGVEGLVAALQKTWSDLAAETEGEESKAFEIEGDYVPLVEKAVRRDGTIPIKIIQPGWGSSGFYPAEVLKRDGPQIFSKETKMYWNHQTNQEEAERPEGDLNNLAAVFTSDARWMDNGPKGAGLYADAKVFEGYQKPVDDLAGHIGVSIRALGKAVQGSAEGREGAIIQSLSARKSVDFVTEPGAGGEIITMFEAARVFRTDKKTKAGTVPAEGDNATHNVANQESNLEEDMDVKELTEKVATLETNNQTLATQNARLSEGLALRDAKDMVKEALQAITSLPDVTKARLTESLVKNPPMKDGTLDKEVFAKAIQEAIKDEIKYLEKITGAGQIRGLGESQNDEEEDDAAGKKVEESLTESFTTLGLSEKGAKIAATGRR